MWYCVPERIRFQHDEIKEEFSNAASEGGKIGSTSRIILDVVLSHFVFEEELIFPLLSILQPIAEDKLDISKDDALKLIEKIKGNIVVLNEEHMRVVVALKSLIKVAKDENKQEYLRFVVRLLLHIREEKEFIYPTVIVIVNYLELKMKMLEISDYKTTKVIWEKAKYSRKFIPEIDTRVYTLIRDRNITSFKNLYI